MNPTTSPILRDLPMPILTPRLLIRPCAAGDGKAVNDAIRESFKELAPWMPFAAQGIPPVEKTEEGCRRSAAQFILREDLRVLLFTRDGTRFIGGSGLHRINWDHGLFENGYWVRTSEAGKGYATEAAHALTRYAFEVLGARRVDIHCNPENIASMAVPEKLGFVKEAVLKNHDTFAAPTVKCRDHVYWARTDLVGMPPLDVKWP